MRNLLQIRLNVVWSGGDFITMKQYTIGKFATLNKITPRMLRHYDKIGLLKPNAVLENGYRAYTSAQIQTVSSIRLYHSCGFSLAEVKDLLNSDETVVQQAAKTKLAELDQLDKTEQLAREQLLSLANDLLQPYTNYYDISYTEQSERLLFCCVAPVSETEIENAIDQLYHTLDMLGTSPTGILLLLGNLEVVDAYRVAVPVKTPLVTHGYTCVTLEPSWYLSTIHYGDYYSIGMAYDSLLSYAVEKGLQLKSSFLECYLFDSENASSPSKYITQIFIKLTP